MISKEHKLSPSRVQDLHDFSQALSSLKALQWPNEIESSQLFSFFFRNKELVVLGVKFTCTMFTQSVTTHLKVFIKSLSMFLDIHLALTGWLVHWLGERVRRWKAGFLFACLFVFLQPVFWVLGYEYFITSLDKHECLEITHFSLYVKLKKW